MIPPSMSRPLKVLFISGAAVVAATLTTACGSEKITVPEASSNHAGAVLFNQRCSGCHTLSYAAANGSAANVRSAQYNNGPNFNIRCERPVDRVLYAIENGGFSGQIMPQNIVTGQQAREVAQFVATYAGRKAPMVPGAVECNKQPVGTLLAANSTGSSSSSSPSSSSSSSSSSTTTTSPAKGQKAAPAKQKKK